MSGSVSLLAFRRRVEIYHTIGVHICHFHQISRNVVMHSNGYACIKHAIFHCDLKERKKNKEQKQVKREIYGKFWLRNAKIGKVLGEETKKCSHTLAHIVYNTKISQGKNGLEQIIKTWKEIIP